MDNFQYKDLSVDVTVDIDNRKLEYEDSDGIKIVYEIDKFEPDLGNKKIYVGYVRKEIGQTSGRIIRTDRSEYTEPNYSPFYNVIPLISIGEFSSKSIMNGLIRRLPEFGGSTANPGALVVFNMNDGSGDFFQPVVLNSATVTNATEGNSDGTISVNVANGVGPYTYQLDEEAGQASNEFTDLAAGSYTIRVEDGEGNWREQSVTVEEQPAV